MTIPDRPLTRREEDAIVAEIWSSAIDESCCICHLWPLKDGQERSRKGHHPDCMFHPFKRSQFKPTAEEWPEDEVTS